MKKTDIFNEALIGSSHLSAFIKALEDDEIEIREIIGCKISTQKERNKYMLPLIEAYTDCPYWCGLPVILICSADAEEVKALYKTFLDKPAAELPEDLAASKEAEKDIWVMEDGMTYNL